MPIDSDLALIQEVRDKVNAAFLAQKKLQECSQKEIDSLVAHLAYLGEREAYSLARHAVEETGFGKLEDKIAKNIFATRDIFNFIKDMKTVGFIDEEIVNGQSVFKVASPVGIIAGIIPSTNPTSTALYKILISLKSGNAIVLSPHPRSRKSTNHAADIMKQGLEDIGLPVDLVSCMTDSSLEATRTLMSHPCISLILATGGMGLVKAAYASGKPAYGVGPGNVPAFIERTADIRKAVKDIIVSKTFDYGTICASEQAVIVEEIISSKVENEFLKQGAYFLKQDEISALAKALFPDGKHVNPELVGQPPDKIAHYSGIRIGSRTKVIMVRLEEAKPDCSLCYEKLSPVLSCFVRKDWESACQLCLELLALGGQGHTLSIHSRNENIIREFALKKPVNRILVNTPSSHGAIGYSTGLDASLTLGCGTLGGNITSDNITPMHLLNIKRLAFEIREVQADND
ncbi:MAG: aldehyde dehydrogenase family protein [Candidatus Coatesbacteria bacterium]|nr:aldehyde dehydrogenase family protein [Candidatus Coatesbacteria bacterium]